MRVLARLGYLTTMVAVGTLAAMVVSGRTDPLVVVALTLAAIAAFGMADEMAAL